MNIWLGTPISVGYYWYISEVYHTPTVVVVRELHKKLIVEFLELDDIQEVEHLPKTSRYLGPLTVPELPTGWDMLLEEYPDEKDELDFLFDDDASWRQDLESEF
jgi:hypothetical protein